MPLRRSRPWFASLCALALAPAAFATTMLEQDVDALTKSADAVVRARVLSSQARWTSDHARIVTDTELEVLDAWKGRPAARVVVMQPGGIVGELGQKVDGAAKFQPGEEVVLFLEARGDRFTVAGMAQGAFHLARSTDGKTVFARQALDEALLLDPITRQPVSGAKTVLTLEQLKSRVAAVLAAPPTPTVTPPASTRPPLVTP